MRIKKGGGAGAVKLRCGTSMTHNRLRFFIRPTHARIV